MDGLGMFEMDNLTVLAPIILGFVFDSIWGDPYSWPHPIKTFGSLISFFEKKLNKGLRRKLKGGLLWLILGPSVWAFFAGINYLLADYTICNIIFTTVFFFYGLSNRTLINEGLKVEKKLQEEGEIAARKQLSMIVGRDTSKLSASKIRMAVVETLSENLSDGVVAPLFYFAVGGVPLMMCYKMINTLDSMVGYKNERYQDFGYVSAKIDDVANFIPARLTAFLMILVSFRFRAIKTIFKYARAHSSPNAGWPESAIAGILKCRLGGPNEYFGHLVSKPYIGDNPRELARRDIIKCCCVNAGVALLMVGLVMIFTLN